MVASPLVNVLVPYIHHVTKSEGEANAHHKNFGNATQVMLCC